MELTESENFQLNSELLEEKSEKLESPKRGSKEDLIKKILELDKTCNYGLDESLTKLRRRTKTSLNKLLAEMVEFSMKKEIADELGANPANHAHMNICFLRMLHDTMTLSIEKISNPYLEKYGYSIEGYNQSLQAPHISEQLDNVLREIAQDTDCLQYIQSPYSRLLFIHVAAIASTIKKKNCEKLNVTTMESKKSRENNPVLHRRHRSSSIGKKFPDTQLDKTNVRTI